MIEVVSKNEKQHSIIFKANSKLTDEDYKTVLIPELEKILSEHGKARLLLDMGDDFHGWELSAAWDDFRFGMAHRKDFEKMGVVGGPRWVEWSMKIGSLLISGEIKCFPANEREAAYAWIDE
ncbi:MAG: STAS/SEC14 domain-containing protein [Thermoguttaceae bacterium]